MTEKYEGIVLHTVPYSDKYAIVQLYTRQQGRTAFLLSLAHGKQKRTQRTLYAPFSLLEIETTQRSPSQMPRIQQARWLTVWSDIPFNPIKSTITLFLAEVVMRGVREHEPNESLFQFLGNAIQLLDHQERGVANFHLCFLIQLSSYLGFYPNVEGYQRGYYFDLRNGVVTQAKPYHTQWLSPHHTARLVQLLRMNFSNLHCFQMNQSERREVLQQTIAYFEIHMEGFSHFKSLEVLTALFS